MQLTGTESCIAGQCIVESAQHYNEHMHKGNIS